MASFIVAGSFLVLGTLTMATLPHYFSCTDPLPPQRRPLNHKDQKGSESEMEQMKNVPPHTSPAV